MRAQLLFKLYTKISGIFPVIDIILKSLSLEKDNRILCGAMKCYDIERNSVSEGDYLVQN